MKVVADSDSTSSVKAVIINAELFYVSYTVINLTNAKKITPLSH